MRSYVTGILFVASVLHLAQTVNGQDTSYYVPMFVWLTARTTWKQEYADIYTEDFRKLEYQMCQKVRQAVHENSIISEAYIGCEFEEFAREGNIWGKMKLEFHKDKYEQSGMTAGFLETYLNDNTDSQYFAGFYNTDKSESISDFAASRLKAAQRTSSTSTVTTEEATTTTSTTTTSTTTPATTTTTTTPSPTTTATTTTATTTTTTTETTSTTPLTTRERTTEPFFFRLACFVVRSLEMNVGCS
ncbi:unnamed protein product [Calicophoron daubneyi]|uniref:Uncharacterized protein n=1 Tax=Calicophoron daubneyi TaxID=300641 RepID=A0AAV2SYL9_CALDB